MTDRDTFLSERRKGVGGSDAPAVLGISPWKSAYELYLEKRGELSEEDLTDNEAVHFGNVLEDVVAQEYVRRTGRKVARVNKPLVHPDRPYMRVNLDRRIVGERRILECKTADRFTAHQWGEEGTDQVPDHYAAQCFHSLAVVGADAADLAVLIGGNRFAIYTLERDDTVIQMLYEREADFWRAVTEGTPPDVDGSHATDDLLKRLFPSSVKVPIHLDPASMSKWVQQLREARQDVKWAESRYEEAKHRIQVVARDASEIMLAGDLVATWRQGKDAKAVDLERLKAEYPDVYKAVLTTRPGARPFLPK